MRNINPGRIRRRLEKDLQIHLYFLSASRSLTLRSPRNFTQKSLSEIGYFRCECVRWAPDDSIYYFSLCCAVLLSGREGPRSEVACFVHQFYLNILAVLKTKMKDKPRAEASATIGLP